MHTETKITTKMVIVLRAIASLLLLLCAPLTGAYSKSSTFDERHPPITINPMLRV
jgi:hypothetical protein